MRDDKEISPACKAPKLRYRVGLYSDRVRDIRIRDSKQFLCAAASGRDLNPKLPISSADSSPELHHCLWVAYIKNTNIARAKAAYLHSGPPRRGDEHSI